MEKRRAMVFVKSVGLVLVLAFGIGTAQASTTQLGTLSAGDYRFSAYVSPGHSFNNFARFRLDDAAHVTSFIGSLEVSFASFSLLGIDNFSASLQKLGNGGFQTLATSTGSGLSFNDLLAPGRYRIALSGDASGLLGGFYQGALHVAAVPEADTWIMLLVGFGIVLYQLRRKQRSIEMQPLSA